jgi:hypothetical protein
MPKFIRLSTFLLNTNAIQKITITPNKYCIYVVGKQINGLTFNVAGFGVGNLHTYTGEIEVCKTKHLTDYKIVTDWINKNYPVDPE